MRNPEFVKAAFSAIAPRYVATNHVLSMGVDLLWRQRVVQLVSEWKPENLLHLVCADAMNLPFPSASYDAVTVAFGLRNMASYPDALREMGRMLRPGGHLLILDFSLPESLLKSPYRFYLHRILPVIAGKPSPAGRP